jgi:gamma-glutamylcyclotransferase (GGCT)/AIG2-like uncharacterized protein YtfP
MANKFFVYGTLKEGGYYAGHFDDYRTSNKVAVLKGHDLFSIGRKTDAYFPGAVPGKGKIVGEVHEYGNAPDATVLTIMDSIEGYSEGDEVNSLYLRKKCEVELEDGTVETAYVYIFNRPIEDYYHKVEDGVWEI